MRDRVGITEPDSNSLTPRDIEKWQKGLQLGFTDAELQYSFQGGLVHPSDLMQNNIAPSRKHLWYVLDLVQEKKWIAANIDVDPGYWTSNTKLFCEFLEWVEKNNRPLLRPLFSSLFLSGLNFRVIRDARTAAEEQDFLTKLQDIVDKLTEYGVSPVEIRVNISLTDLKHSLFRQNLETYLQEFPQHWNTESDTWTLKSDPSITVFGPDLKAAVRTALKVHHLNTTYPEGGLDTVVNVSECHSGGNRLALINHFGNLQILYISSCLLGRGTYGVVHKVVELGGRVLATKTAASPDAIASLANEYRTLMAIYQDKQHITGLQPRPLGCITIKEGMDFTFYSIVSDLFSHSLWDEIEGRNSKNQPISRMIVSRNAPGIANDYMRIFNQSVEGLVALHSRDFFHGDVKSNNIVVDKSTKSVFLIDLGSAETTIPKADDKPSFLGPTPLFALEADVNECEKSFKAGQFTRYKKVRKAIDVYGLGVTLHHFFALSFPFTRLSNKDSYPKPEHLQVDRIGFQKNLVPSSLTNLVGEMLQLNIEKRPSASELAIRLNKIKHSFMY